MSTPLPGTLIDRSFRERIILVGVVLPGTNAEEVDAALDELALLVDTAGADVVHRVVQRLSLIHISSPSSARVCGGTTRSVTWRRSS